MLDSKTNRKITISIPAYDVSMFIEECLDSIVNQKHLSNYDYEILVGIDGCDKTKGKLLEIKHNYEFLKVFWFPKNVGGYVVRNTLAYKAMYNNLIFFDADDIMNDILVLNVIECLMTYPIVRFMYNNFGEGNWAGRRSKEPASGVFGIKNSVFKELGGFVEFRVSSDDEFRDRSMRLGYKTCNIVDKNLFFRRRHKKSLTGDLTTKSGSVYRSGIYKKIDELHQLRIKKINPVFGECELI